MGWKGHWTLQGSAGRCREAWEGFEGGRRQSWKRKKEVVAGIYRWTLQLVGKAWKRHASLLDAAGKRGRVLRGAGGSLGTVRKSCWLEMPLDAPGPRSRKKKRVAGKVRLKRPLDAAGKRGLERPLDAAGKRWTLQGSVGGF